MIRKLLRFNGLMFVAMLALIAIGTAWIYSAGNARPEAVFHAMWQKNLWSAAIGLAL